jgi:hypothetical protein
LSRFNLTRTGFDRLPGLHPLFLDYIGPRTAPFYPEGSSIDDIERFARSRRGGGVAGVADVLAAQAARWGASSEPARALGRGAVAVVAGEQAGHKARPRGGVLKARTAGKQAGGVGGRGGAAGAR